MRDSVRNGIGQLAMLLLFASAGGCNNVWDANEGRDALTKAGYVVGAASSPDPDAQAVAAVKDSQCFDVTKAAERARVCVWTCETSQACSNIPQQKVWMHGTFGRRNAYVDAKDEKFGNAVLTALHP